jgi:hypothetical protein
MLQTDHQPIQLAELKEVLRATDSAAHLMPSRILRRIIKQDRHLTGIGLQVPHRKTYLIERETLLKLASRRELDLEPDRALPGTVLLLLQPEPDRLSITPRSVVLLKYWRLLFHARAHLAMEHALADPTLAAATIRKQVLRLGQTAFDEIRAVLRQENLLLPPRNDRSVLVEFAATYLELRYFAPALIARYFPALRDRADIEEILSQQVAGTQVLASTRLAGALDPAPAREEGISPGVTAPARLSTRGQPAPGQNQRIRDQAPMASNRGNMVRAAILYWRAAASETVEPTDKRFDAARAELDRLAAGLQTTLGLDKAQTQQWRQALPPLLSAAAQGTWLAEARLLYDLQKACIDSGRDIYALDLVEWLTSFMRRPIKRLLPHQRALLLSKHCRTASARLPSARLSESERRQLAPLLHQAVRRSEERLRDRLRPRIDATLREVGLQPRNMPEQVAYQKLIEELLDLVVERGFLTLSDLRDAVSRNNLKLPDLAGPGEFLAGDALLRTDHRLAVDLDGVYRRGEVYLRGLQRLSSLAFGTWLGRCLMRYLVLPFGGAFVAIEGTLHMINPLRRWSGRPKVELSHEAMAGWVVGLGVLLFALLHSRSCRSLVGRGLRLLGCCLAWLLLELPAAVLSLPPFRALLSSRLFARALDFILKPGAVSAVAALLFPLYGIRGRAAWVLGGASFVLASLVLNSRWGQIVQEGVLDALVRTWLRFRIDIFPALFGFTMGLFRSLVEGVERLIYTVDEWLRFRAGDRRLSLLTKTVLGFLWFFATYIVRIYVNLFIEPTVNPIKHFPVVTVSAKLLIPLIPVLWPLLTAPFQPFGPVVANAMASINLALMPGIFGFLVWEFKENWRLYEANRPQRLGPAHIGHHGETLPRLLKPGFHSGTIPKLYARLRRAERWAFRTSDYHASFKCREALHHVEERIRLFFEREFLALLNASRRWGPDHAVLGRVNVSSNRVGVEVFCPSQGEGRAWVIFEERAGWLVAGTVLAEWPGKMTSGQRGALATTLAGLYKLAGVELIREQVEACFELGKFTFDILEEGLVVWSSTGYEVQGVYPLRETQVLVPAAPGSREMALPALDTQKLLFAHVPICWTFWVDVWEADQANKDPDDARIKALRLLPCETT